MTDKLRRQLAKLEARPTPSFNLREQMARLYIELGRMDEGRRMFAELATEIIARHDPEFAMPTYHLAVGNMLRLAGDTERATANLRQSRDLLAPMARITEDEKPPLLYTLLLLGADDELLTTATEFGEAASGPWAWLAAETVRAHRAGDTAEVQRLLAEWDGIANAEPEAVNGRHPSARDLRALLLERIDGGDSVTSDAPPSGEPTPSPTVVAEAPIDGDVIGWWGHYVVVAGPNDSVALFDSTTGRVSHQVSAQPAGAIAWDPASALFAHGQAGYALVTTATGIAATVIRPGGWCRFSRGGHLLTVERGSDASVHRADGVELATGRTPVAISPAGDAYATTTDDATIRVTTLDADLTPTDFYDVPQPCSTMAWFPSGDRLACAEDAGQTVRTVELPSGEVLDEAILHEDDPIVAVAVAPSGEMFASVGFDGVLGVRDLTAARSTQHSFDERLEDVSWDVSGGLLGVQGERGWFVVTSAGARLDIDVASSLAWHPTDQQLAVGRPGRLTVLSY